MSESCIHVNVHVPSGALPSQNQTTNNSTDGLPVVVFVHGGAFQCGSGDADIYGPEFLMNKGVIVITFNYRLDFLGFLSLGTTKIPGNNGLRDAVTLLRWVQRNVRYFGGNPDEVTLAGQSAGSNNVHLLSLNPVTEGLFKRVWLMSGTAYPSDFTSVPAYAETIATSFLTLLGLNGTDYDTVHDQLVEMPIDVLHNTSYLLTEQAFTTFMPVQESDLPGVTAMLTDDPAKLVANGTGDDIPLVIGMTNSECETFRTRLADVDVVGLYESNPLTALGAQRIYTLSANESAIMVEQIKERYFGEDPTLDEYINLCSDSFFKYATLKYVRDRAARGGAPMYLYKFSYAAEYSVIKLAFGLNFTGAGHIEDTNNIFKVNSYTVPDSSMDDSMKDWMSDMFANFVRTGAPASADDWPSQTSTKLEYQELNTPQQYQYKELSADDQDMLEFYDEINYLQF